MTSKRDQKKINFDNYADNYKEYIAKSIGNIENNLNYYQLKKRKILKKELGYHPKKILDLGCGVGTMLGLLIENFKKVLFMLMTNQKKAWITSRKIFQK